MVQFNFNSNQYEPSTGGPSVWESGIYDVQITKSEVKETKAKTGYMLVLTMAALAPEMRQKTIIARLNIQNQNQTAVDIAMSELAAISIVCGVPQWQDTQQLHGRPFKINVEKGPRSDDPTKEGNEIKAYMDMNGQPPTKGGQGGGAPAAPSAPAQPTAQQPPAQQQQPAFQPPAQDQGQQQPPAQNQQPQFQPQPDQQAAPPAQNQQAPQFSAPPAQQSSGGGAPVPPWMQNQG